MLADRKILWLHCLKILNNLSADLTNPAANIGLEIGWGQAAGIATGKKHSVFANQRTGAAGQTSIVALGLEQPGNF